MFNSKRRPPRGWKLAALAVVLGVISPFWVSSRVLNHTLIVSRTSAVGVSKLMVVDRVIVEENLEGVVEAL